MENLPKINKKTEKIAKGFDQPTEHLQSEGEILIKNLVQKQLSTNINLNEQLSNKKEFVSPQDLIQITDYKSGETSLNKFRETTEHLNLIENLKFYGLNQDVIGFYLDSQKGNNYLKTKYKNLSKDFLDNRLKKINEKINFKKSEPENLLKNNISRHLKEFASSIKPNSEETKLFNFACSNLKTKQDNLPLEHPINNLKNLENELFGHLDREEMPSLTKRRKIMKKLEVKSNNSYNPDPNLKTKSNWDIRDCDITTGVNSNLVNYTNDFDLSSSSSSVNNNSLISTNVDKNSKEKIYTCQPINYYTIKDGKIIKLENSSKEITNETLETKSLEFKRLTDDEIRLNPKFSNYERGIPSKVLYVKNIPKNGKAEFLDIFQSLSCDNNKPNIKLMTGKMQGQAFITFKDENQATDALNKYNGYYIKEKPIIISYGKTK